MSAGPSSFLEHKNASIILVATVIIIFPSVTFVTLPKQGTYLTAVSGQVSERLPSIGFYIDLCKV